MRKGFKTVENIYQEARVAVEDAFVIAFDLCPLLVLVMFLRTLKIGVVLGEEMSIFE